MPLLKQVGGVRNKYLRFYSVLAFCITRSGISFHSLKRCFKKSAKEPVYKLLQFLSNRQLKHYLI